MAISSDTSFENWLQDKLCKFLSDTDNNDTSVFLNYIISLLNEEDASLEEKKSSIEPILQDLDPVNLFRNINIKRYFCNSSKNSSQNQLKMLNVFQMKF